MAQVCDICGKGPQFGNKISHAHNVSRRRWNVNLRPVRARVNGANRRVRVCTTCLKSGKVVKASVGKSAYSSPPATELSLKAILQMQKPP